MKVLFCDALNIRVPPGFNSAVASAAYGQKLTQGEFVRRAIVAGIRDAGITPPPIPPAPRSPFKNRKG